jgi:hypothetical protein
MNYCGGKRVALVRREGTPGRLQDKTVRPDQAGYETEYREGEERGSESQEENMDTRAFIREQ